MTKSEEKLVDLLDGIADHYLNKLAKGEMDSKDIANVLTLLKNNDITVDVRSGEPLDLISKTLPFSNTFGNHKKAA